MRGINKWSYFFFVLISSSDDSFLASIRYLNMSFDFFHCFSFSIPTNLGFMQIKVNINLLLYYFTCSFELVLGGTGGARWWPRGHGSLKISKFLRDI